MKEELVSPTSRTMKVWKVFRSWQGVRLREDGEESNNVEGGRSRSRETEKGREGGRKEMMVRGELAKAAEVRGLPLPFCIFSFFPPKTLCYSPDHRKGRQLKNSG